MPWSQAGKSVRHNRVGSEREREREREERERAREREKEREREGEKERGEDRERGRERERGFSVPGSAPECEPLLSEEGTIQGSPALREK